MLHDINLAMQYADRIIFMKDGKIAREGKVPDIITADLIKEVFDIPVDIIANPFGNSAIMFIATFDFELLFFTFSPPARVFNRAHTCNFKFNVMPD